MPRESLLRRRLANSLSGSASARRVVSVADASHRTRGTRYWRATSDSSLYGAPLGGIIGEVEAGTVLKEVNFFTDAFGTSWIGALNADDSEILWVRRHEESAIVEVGAPLFEQVVEETGVRADGSEAQSGSDAEDAPEPIPVKVAAMSFDHDLGQVAMDVSRITEFWTKCREHGHSIDQGPPVMGEKLAGEQRRRQEEAASSKSNRFQYSPLSAARDWNSEFQAHLERLILNPQCESTDSIRADILAFYGDVVSHCQDAVALIVQELSLPQGERTIPAASHGVYFADGLIFTLCIDSTNAAFGGDARAMKIASQVARSAAYFASVGPRYLLHQPLRIVLNFMGYRVMASTVPPVTIDSLVAGSADGGITVKAPTAFVTRAVEAALAELNIRTGSDSGVCGLPCDSGVFAGRDERLYVLNIGRLVPPRAPVARVSYVPRIDGLFCRHRAELFPDLRKPLSADAFVPRRSTAEENLQVASLTQWVRDAAIPTVAAVLSFMEPTVAPTEIFTCAATGEHHSEHICFVVCNSEKECCKISPQALVNLVKLACWDEKPDEAQAKAKTFVKCEGNCRSINGFVMKPDVKAIFHAHGVNLAYLGYVHSRISATARPCTSHYLEEEIISRAAKTIVWRDLRAAVSEEARHAACVRFFTGLLQPEGKVAEEFWSEELGPQIVAQFDVLAPFDTSRLDRELVYRKAAELVGISLTEESVASMFTDTPYVQVEVPHSALKDLMIPRLVEQAGDGRALLSELRESYMMHWIATPDELKGGDTWAKVKPCYANDDATLACQQETM